MQVEVFNSAATHSLSATHRAERATTKKQLRDESKAAESPILATYSSRAQPIFLLIAHSPVKFKRRKGILG